MIRGTFFGHTECPSNEMFTNIVPSVSCPYLVVCLLLQHVEGGFGINIARRPTSLCVCVCVFCSNQPIRPQPYPVIYAVANPARGLLGRKRSEEHLQSYNESMKTKTTKRKEQKHNAHGRTFSFRFTCAWYVCSTFRGLWLVFPCLQLSPEIRSRNDRVLLVLSFTKRGHIPLVLLLLVLLLLLAPQKTNTTSVATQT